MKEKADKVFQWENLYYISALLFDAQKVETVQTEKKDLNSQS